MTEFRNKLKFLVLLLIPFLGSCSGDNEMEGDSNDYDFSSIIVARNARSLPSGMGETEAGEVPAIINESFSTDDVLYISQMGTNVDPSFESGASNLYKYIYYENEEETPTWEQGYNFKKALNSEALNWGNIVALGSVGNAFAFYGMYFPGGTPIFQVNTDQTGGKENPFSEANFLTSDILGAYHTTSATYTRMRFNLFHLMVYLKVTIYVPVYSDQYNEEGNSEFSGFNKGAMLGAFMMNTIPTFTIDWRAGRSSDTEPPLTKTNGNGTKIQMYMHEPDENSGPIEINVRDYYKGGDITTDKVRAYNFSVLFPQQTFAQNSNIICFELENPMGSSSPHKYYYFSSNQLISETTDYALNQGTLQQLYLYLPRTTNKTILIGAKILDWGNTSTEMTVTSSSSDSEFDDIDNP